jgi:hypothetical protein
LEALQCQSEAIHNALSKYNKQATGLNPPRPTLTWKEIADYSFLGEFDLLRNSRTDVRQEQWSQPAYREAMIKHFKLCRAQEEIVRLNVETRRLRTSIHYEMLHVRKVVSHLTSCEPSLAAAVQHWWTLRSAVNARLVQQLDEIESLAGYTGQRGIGIPKNSREGLAAACDEGSGLTNLGAVLGDADDHADELELHAKTVEQITDFIQCITD